jgi:Tfp pilus assembly protein PilF
VRRAAQKPGRPRFTDLMKVIGRLAAQYDDDDELTGAANVVLDFIHADKLDEAKQAARQFLVRIPDIYNGYNLLGMVYEARGDNKKAVDYYRKAIDFIRERSPVIGNLTKQPLPTHDNCYFML